MSDAGEKIEEKCPDPSVHGNPFRYCPYCSWVEPPLCGWPIRSGMQVMGCQQPVVRDGRCEDHARLNERWKAEADQFAEGVAREVTKHLTEGGDLS